MGSADPAQADSLQPSDFPQPFDPTDLRFKIYNPSSPPAAIAPFLASAAFPAHGPSAKHGAHDRVVADHVRINCYPATQSPLGGHIAWYTPPRLGRRVIVGYAGLMINNYGAGDGTRCDAYVTDFAILPGIGGSGHSKIVLDYILDKAKLLARLAQEARRIGFLVSRDSFGASLGEFGFSASPDKYHTAVFGQVRVYERVFKP